MIKVLVTTMIKVLVTTKENFRRTKNEKINERSEMSTKLPLKHMLRAYYLS